MAERCVCCGEIIPEGRQVCPNCEKGSTMATEQRLINADTIVRIANEAKIKHPRKYLSWELLKYLISKVPTVNAVVIPDCSKCFYSDRIEHWDKCDRCIGNKHEDNFISREEVEDGR